MSPDPARLLDQDGVEKKVPAGTPVGLGNRRTEIAGLPDRLPGFAIGDPGGIPAVDARDDLLFGKAPKAVAKNLMFLGIKITFCLLYTSPSPRD